MNRLVNQNWINFNGEPVTGRTPPTLIVYGPPMTSQQEGEVAHTYKLFTDANLVALGQYQVRNRVFADGTRVRCVSINGVDTVQVWTAGKEESPYETLFYAVPSSSLHPNGYTPAESPGPLAVWREYNKSNTPPETVKHVSTLDDRIGFNTWFSSKIRLNAEGYSPVMPLVVSWKWGGYRYGAYGPTQPNYGSFAFLPSRTPSTFPGMSYGSTNPSSPGFSVWLNDTEVVCGEYVYSAAVRIYEPEGAFLLVCTASTFDIKVYRVPINLPIKKGRIDPDGWELVATFGFDAVCYQGPYFNESATKMVSISNVYLDATDEYQTCVVEYDIDAQAHSIIHAATKKTTTAEWTEEWTGVGDRSSSSFALTAEVISPQTEIREYAIAADYKRDELVYLLAKTTYSTDDFVTNGNGTATGSHSYSHPVITFSATKNYTYSSSYKFDVVHNTNGTIYSKTFNDVDAHITMVLSGSTDIRNNIGTGDQLTGTTNYSKKYIDSSTASELSKVQAVGGDLRHDLIIIASSSYQDSFFGTLDYEGSGNSAGDFTYETVDGGFVETGIGFSIRYYATNYLHISTSTPVEYVVLHGSDVIYESASKKYTISYPIPDVRVGFPNGTIDDGPSFSSIGYSFSSGSVHVQPVEYGPVPYVAPVSQPVYLPISQSGELYSAIVAANGNNQPGACCNIAWSPAYSDDPQPEIGYVSFISPPLYSASGDPVAREKFEKFYIGGEWVDSPTFAPGDNQTLAAPVFIGTRLK